MDIYFYNSNNKLMIILEKPKSLKDKVFCLSKSNFTANSEFLGQSHIFSNFVYLVDDNYQIPEEVYLKEISSLFSLKENEGRFLLDALAILWKGMPGGLTKNDLNPFLHFDLTQAHEIVFYGGSFNPWHEGHTECLKRCASENIVIIPDFNPWKKSDSNPVCRYSSFIEIYNQIKGFGYSIFPGFWAKDEANPTISWIEDVEVENKSLLIGDDNFIQIFKWTKATKLLEILDKLYVVKRDFKKDDFLRVKKEIFDQGIIIDIIYIEDNSFQDVSSTKIREGKKKGLY